MSATAGIRGSVRVAIYKQREDTDMQKRFWATCDCGWLITNKATLTEVAGPAETHLLVCDGAPHSRARP